MTEAKRTGLHVAVVTPEGVAFEGEAASVVVPAHDGEVAFLRGHAPFVGALGCGALRVTTKDSTVRRWYLEGGVAQVLDDAVTVLADRIQPADKVDAGAAHKDLEEALDVVPTTDEEFASRDRRLDSARARLRLVEPR